MTKLKVSVELDAGVANRLKAAAARHGRPFEAFLSEQIEALPAAGDPFRNLNWDDDLIDTILRDTMASRESQPLRAVDDEDVDRH